MPAQVLPSPNVSFAPSFGTSAVSSRAVASPRAAIAAERLGGDLLEPGFPATGRGHALLLEHPDQARALGGDQRLGAGLVHHRCELDRHDEQRPAHPEHPDERAAAIQRVLEVGRIRSRRPLPTTRGRPSRDRSSAGRRWPRRPPRRSRRATPGGDARRAAPGAPERRRASSRRGRTRGRFGTARRAGPRPARGTSRAVRPPRRRRRGRSERSSRRARPTASPGPRRAPPSSAPRRTRRPGPIPTRPRSIP